MMDGMNFIATLVIGFAMLALVGAWVAVTERFRAKSERHIPKASLIEGELNAPWEELPQLSSVSAGWRQSYGEVCLDDWFRWYSTMPASLRAEYRSRHPEPEEWQLLGFYERTEQRISESP
jgi:hypothetical protein